MPGNPCQMQGLGLHLGAPRPLDSLGHRGSWSLLDDGNQQKQPTHRNGGRQRQPCCTQAAAADRHWSVTAHEAGFSLPKPAFQKSALNVSRPVNPSRLPRGRHPSRPGPPSCCRGPRPAVSWQRLPHAPPAGRARKGQNAAGLRGTSDGGSARHPGGPRTCWELLWDCRLDWSLRSSGAPFLDSRLRSQ